MTGSGTMKSRPRLRVFPTNWRFILSSVTFLIVVFCIGSPGLLGGGGGGVEARRRYTYLNKWFKVACIAENLKGTDHYICDEHGYIRCLPGWTNEHELCQTPICNYDCVPGQGNCTGPDTCTCEVGWMGANCSRCICLPGCVNGACELPFECKCEPGWTGMLCDKPICKPGCIHGHCNAPGECVCHPGWTGPNCTECLPLPGCHWQNGYCNKPMECRCKNGYHGNFCKHANCTPGCHPQYGYCLRPDTCWCHTGWTGSTCSECMRYPGCQNGDCNLPWECICRDGWHGKLCDQPGNAPATTAYPYQYGSYDGSGNGLNEANNAGGTFPNPHDPHFQISKRDTDPKDRAASEAISDITNVLESSGVIASEVTQEVRADETMDSLENFERVGEPVENIIDYQEPIDSDYS